MFITLSQSLIICIITFLNGNPNLTIQCVFGLPLMTDHDTVT